MEQAGTIYLVPTPIGNLEDMTYRAVRILQEVDLICAEDTRQTRKLLSHFQIHTKLLSMHAHNEKQRVAELLTKISDGKNLAVVSDAGTPLVSDPGQRLVSESIAAGYRIVPLPGANAALTALIASGLGGGPFYFHGFLPRKKKEFKETVETLNQLQVPLIFYESPHRLAATLDQLKELWGDREAVVARELTKHYENFHRDTISNLSELGKDEPWRGECCLIVAGATEEEAAQQRNEWWRELSISEHVKVYERKGWGQKDALKQCARDRGISKRVVYADYHKL